MGRPRKPDALSAVERSKASRAARALKTVGLPGTTLDALDAVLRPDESRPAGIARLVADEAERLGR